MTERRYNLKYRTKLCTMNIGNEAIRGNEDEDFQK